MKSRTTLLAAIALLPGFAHGQTCDGNSPIDQAVLDAITQMDNGHYASWLHGGDCGTMAYWNNPDVSYGSSLVFCTQADDTGDVLNFPRCATDCNAAPLASQSCSRMCANG